MTPFSGIIECHGCNVRMWRSLAQGYTLQTGMCGVCLNKLGRLRKGRLIDTFTGEEMGMGGDMKEAADEAAMKLKGHPEYHAILEEMRALHVRKAADYGSQKDPIANCHEFAEWGVEPHKGMMLRVGEKVKRLKAYCVNGKLENEGVEDTLKDIAGCAILALICFREEQKK